MTKNRDRSRTRIVVSICDRAADHCRHTERAVVIARARSGTNGLCVTAGVEIDLQRRERKDVRKRSLFLAQARQSLHRKRSAGGEAGRLIEHVAAVVTAW